MVRQTRWIVLAAALVATTGLAADRRSSLADVKVADTQQVAPAQYAEAAALATRGAPPLYIALAIVGPFEGTTQHIIQVNEGAESASASRVTVLRDGLLDAAAPPQDMDLPGYRCHALTGDRKGDYAVSVSGNWRITFAFAGEDAIDVNLEDDH